MISRHSIEALRGGRKIKQPIALESTAELADMTSRRARLELLTAEAVDWFFDQSNSAVDTPDRADGDFRAARSDHDGTMRSDGR